MEDRKQEYIYYSTLKKNGWTDTLIKKLLGPQDKEVKNPHYKSGPPAKLYLLNRVQEAEQTEMFQSKQINREKRTASAQKAITTKHNNTISDISSIIIKIPIISDKKLIKKAVESRNNTIPESALEKGNIEFISVKDIKPWPEQDKLRDRIVVNYLRHQISDYDYLLENLSGRVGRYEAHQILRKRVYLAISEKYPHLDKECKRQMEERGVKC